VFVQLYTQVEAFAAAISKLQELGFKVNTEESELVYRGAAGETQRCSVCWSLSALPIIALLC
jgi:hypothetical protein